jgi:hypothetical protein
MKSTPYTEPKSYAFNYAPRCLAKTRRGTLCQAPAIRGRSKCRLHGCGKGSGAPRGNQHALKHGQSTAQVKAFKKEVRQLIRQSQEVLKKID